MRNPLISRFSKTSFPPVLRRSVEEGWTSAPHRWAIGNGRCFSALLEHPPAFHQLFHLPTPCSSRAFHLVPRYSAITFFHRLLVGHPPRPRSLFGPMFGGRLTSQSAPLKPNPFTLTLPYQFPTLALSIFTPSGRMNRGWKTTVHRDQPRLETSQSRRDCGTQPRVGPIYRGTTLGHRVCFRPLSTVCGGEGKGEGA